MRVKAVLNNIVPTTKYYYYYYYTVPVKLRGT
jgi:hypothetical protein